MPRPRFAKLPPQRRLQIVEVAMGEFARWGYEGASLNRILKGAELSKGAAYYYFDSKEDVFVLVVSTALAQVIEAVGELDEDSGVSDYWGAVERICANMMLFLLNNPTLAALVRTLATLPKPEGSEAIDGLYEQGRGFAEALIRSGQTQGFVRRDLPFELLRSSVVSVFLGIDQWMGTRWSEITEGDVADVAKVTVELLRRLTSPAGNSGDR